MMNNVVDVDLDDDDVIGGGKIQRSNTCLNVSRSPPCLLLLQTICQGWRDPQYSAGFELGIFVVEGADRTVIFRRYVDFLPRIFGHTLIGGIHMFEYIANLSLPNLT